MNAKFTNLHRADIMQSIDFVTRSILIGVLFFNAVLPNGGTLAAGLPGQGSPSTRSSTTVGGTTTPTPQPTRAAPQQKKTYLTPPQFKGNPQLSPTPVKPGPKVPPRANAQGVHVTLSVDAGAVQLNDGLTFTATVVNNTPNVQTNLLYTDMLDGGLNFVNDPGSPVSFDAKKQQVSYAIASLAAGATLSFSYKLKVVARRQNAALGEIRIHTAKLSLSDGSTQSTHASFGVGTQLASTQSRMATLDSPDGWHDLGKVSVYMQPGAVDANSLLVSSPVTPDPKGPAFQYKLDVLQTGALNKDTTGNLPNQEAPLLSSSGAHFKNPAFIQFNLKDQIDLSHIPAGQEVYVATYDEAAKVWVKVPIVDKDLQNDRVTVEAAHFSTWGSGIGASLPQNGANVLLFDQPYTSLFTGSAQYSVPIWTPQGRNGMSPSVSLSYSSGGYNGVLGDVQAPWVGGGWNIDGTEIVRKITTSGKPYGVYGYENSFTLTVNGTEYDLVADDDPNSGRYTTTQSSFLYIQRHNFALGNAGNVPNTAGEWWEVVTTDGTRYRLGWNNDSEQLALMYGYSCRNATPCKAPDGSYSSSGYAGIATNLVPMRWRVDQVSDAHGNTMNYTYTEEHPAANSDVPVFDRASYLDTISYTGTLDGSLEPGYQVKFVLGDRSTIGDSQPSAFNVWDNYDTKYLWQIKVCYGACDTGTIVRTYAFNYHSEPVPTASGTLVLDSVAISGGGFTDPGTGIWIPATSSATMRFGYTNLANRATTSTENKYVYPRLSSIRNGYGGKLTFAYGNDARAANSWYNYYVATATLDTGVSGTNAVATDYSYGTPVYSDGDTALGALVGYTDTSTSTQDAGGPIGVDNVQQFTHHFGTKPPDIGRELITQSQSGPIGHLITADKTVNTYISDDSAAPFANWDYRYLYETDHYLMSGGVLKLMTMTRYHRDPATGNLAYREDFNGKSLYRTEYYEYLSNFDPAVHILDKMTRDLIVDGSNAIWADTRYHYDGHMSAAPSQGELSLVQRIVSGSQTSDTSYSYDQYGNPIQTCSYAQYGTLNADPVADCIESSVTYDPVLHTYPITQTNALGDASSTAYLYSLGLAYQSTDPNGWQTTSAFDGLGRTLSATIPGSGEVGLKYVYPDASSGSVTAPYSVQLQILDTYPAAPVYRNVWGLYDGIGRIVQTQVQNDVAGPGHLLVLDTSFNAQGLVDRQSNPYDLVAPGGSYATPDWTNQFTSKTYDWLGRLVKVVAPGNITSQTQYDGLTTTSIDPNNHQTIRTTDAFGRLSRVQETNADGSIYATTNYAYDIADRLNAVTDAEGNQTSLQYDLLGRKTFMHDPDMGNWSYQYDAVGNLVTQIDAKSQAINFYYDPLSRLKGKTYNTNVPGNYQPPADPGSYTVAYTYGTDKGSNLGLRIGMTDTSGATNWNYSNFGRTVSETRSIGLSPAITKSSTTTSDWLGRPLTITYPGADTVRYQYDALGQATSLTHQDATMQNEFKLVSLAYNVMGQITTTTLGNNAIITNTYDTDNNRLIKRTGCNSLAAPCDSAGVLMDFNYNYDPGGNILQVQDNKLSETVTYRYDSLNRLTFARDLNTTTGSLLYQLKYTYDQIGNILQANGSSSMAGLAPADSTALVADNSPDRSAPGNDSLVSYPIPVAGAAHRLAGSIGANQAAPQQSADTDTPTPSETPTLSATPTTTTAISLTPSVTSTPTSGLDSFTKVMLHMDGSNGSTAFDDASGKTWTTTGNAQISTAQSVYGGASGLFGGNGDYISTADSSDFAFGTGNFTIDAWVRFNALPSNGVADNIYSQRVDGNNLIVLHLLNSGGAYIWRFYAISNGTTLVGMDETTTISPNTWVHIALVRSGSSFMFFQNGNQVGTTVTSTAAMPDIASPLRVGTNDGTGNYLNGWLDEVRVSKGIARWASNFTPPGLATATPSLTPTRSPSPTRAITLTPTATATFAPDNFIPIKSWNFDTTVEGWNGNIHTSGLNWISGGYAAANITDNDPFVVSPANLTVPITSNRLIRIRFKNANNTGSTGAQVFFTTAADSAWNATKSKAFSAIADSAFHDYTIDMSNVAGWTGTLTQLRFDPPGSGGSFSIDAVRIGTDLNANPAGWWNFEEGSGSTITDISGHVPAGTFSGSGLAGARAAGVSGNAIYLNTSSQYVSIPNDSSLTPAYGLTISAWVYPVERTSGQTYTIINKGDTNPDYRLRVNSSGNLEFNMSDLAAVPPGATPTAIPSLTPIVAPSPTPIPAVVTGPKLPLNTWSMVTAMWSPGEGLLKLYVNGVLVATRAVSGAPAYSANNLYLGYTSNDWVGGLDEVQIYARALLDAQVAALYGQVPATPAGPSPTVTPILTATATDVPDAVNPWGDGHDLSLVVSGTYNLSADGSHGRTCADGVAYSVIGLGSAAATLNTAPANSCLNNGDEVMLVNMQDPTGVNLNTGNFEFLRVDHVNGAIVYFMAEKTRFYGDGFQSDAHIGVGLTQQKVMLVRVPNYTDVTVNGTLTASGWNGLKNGVVVFRASGTLSGSGTISMNGSGYRGNDPGTSANVCGESYGGFGSLDACLGGGGAGARSGGTGDVAGGGAYGTNGGAGQGMGGRAYGVPNLDRLYPGSAGGRGYGNHDANTNTGPGGNGGGIVYILASSVTMTGDVTSNGESGSGNPGAGAGGSIRLDAGTIDPSGSGSITLDAIGGAATPGAGGVGRVAVYYQNRQNSISDNPQAHYTHISTAPATLTPTSTSIVLATPVLFDWGTGSDGPLGIGTGDTFNLNSSHTGARNCPDGVAYNVTELGATYALINAAPPANGNNAGTWIGCIDPGDELLLINMQGTAADNTNTGNYELVRVGGISNNLISFFRPKTRYYGSAATNDNNIGLDTGQQKVMLMRVPNYSSVTVNGTLTAKAWDGWRYGVLAFRAKGTLTLGASGAISMDGNGYRGTGNTDTHGGACGESYGGFGNTGACLGGGGAGDSSGLTHTEGGGGGNGSVGGTGFGTGGSAYGAAPLDDLIPGSAGGRGYGNHDSGTSTAWGGDGGGIIYLLAHTITMPGTANITSNGANGSDNPSAGAGGSVRIEADTITALNPVNVSGGTVDAGYRGSGGRGRIAVYYWTSLGTTGFVPGSAAYIGHLGQPATPAPTATVAFVVTLVQTSVAATATPVPPDSYTKVLLHFDGTDGATTFTDTSSKSWVASGNAQIDTASKVLGSGSLLLGGTGDDINTADSPDFAFGSGPFTIDTWVRFGGLPASGVNAMVYSQQADTSNRVLMYLNNTGGAYRWRFLVTDAGTNTVNMTVPITITTGVWHHIAIVRNNDDFVMYEDGSQIGSTLTVPGVVLPNLAARVRIGTQDGTVGPLNGRLDEYRVTKGIARWTSDFTPGATPTPLVTTLANPGINQLAAYWALDEMSGNRNDSYGSTTLQPGNLASMAGVSGNALMLNPGSSQGASAADNPSVSLHGTPFTIAGWAYFSALPAANDSINLVYKWGALGNLEYTVSVAPSGQIWFAVSPDGTVYPAVLSSQSITPHAWNHFAAVYDGTQLSIYVNAGTPTTRAYTSGVRDGTNPFYLGIGNASLTQGLDEVGIWKRALTQGEIAWLYNNGLGHHYKDIAPNPGTTNLAAYWSMDESSGNRADALGTTGLVPYNNPGSGTGIKGNALMLNAASAQGVSAADNGNVSLAGTPFTITGWTRLNAPLTTNQNIVYKWGATYEYAVTLATTGQIWFAVSSNGTNYSSMLSSQSLAPGSWYHFAAVYDGTKLALYVNAGTPNTLPYSAGVFDGTNPIYLNAPGGTSVAQSIDEVAIWKRALSPAEIAWLYNNGGGRSYAEIQSVAQTNLSYAYPTPVGTNATVGPHAVSSVTDLNNPGAAPSTYSYDNNGNMSQRTVNGVTTAFTYDAENRLTAVSNTTGPTLSIINLYDGDDTRVGQLVDTGSGPILTAYFMGGAYEVTVASNGTQTGWRKYYSLGGQSVLDSGTGADGSTSAGLSYPLTDQQGSTVAIIAPDGSVTQQRYLPFGQMRSGTGLGSLGQTDFGYTGQRLLGNNLGLMDYRARMYDPTIGRFIQPDPIVSDPADPQTWNRYGYVSNNPIRFTDPTGHFCVDPVTMSMCIGTVVAPEVTVAVVVVAIVAIVLWISFVTIPSMVKNWRGGSSIPRTQQQNTQTVMNSTNKFSGNRSLTDPEQPKCFWRNAQGVWYCLALTLLAAGAGYELIHCAGASSDAGPCGAHYNSLNDHLQNGTSCKAYGPCPTTPRDCSNDPSNYSGQCGTGGTGGSDGKKGGSGGSCRDDPSNYSGNCGTGGSGGKTGGTGGSCLDDPSNYSGNCGTGGTGGGTGGTGGGTGGTGGSCRDDPSNYSGQCG